MLVERTFYCSRRLCSTHVTSSREWPQMGVATCDLDCGEIGWFCSWECVLFAAGERAPLTEIDA